MLLFICYYFHLQVGHFILCFWKCIFQFNEIHCLLFLKVISENNQNFAICFFSFFFLEIIYIVIQKSLHLKVCWICKQSKYIPFIFLIDLFFFMFTCIINYNSLLKLHENLKVNIGHFHIISLSSFFFFFWILFLIE